MCGAEVVSFIANELAGISTPIFQGVSTLQVTLDWDTLLPGDRAQRCADRAKAKKAVSLVILHEFQCSVAHPCSSAAHPWFGCPNLPNRTL